MNLDKMIDKLTKKDERYTAFLQGYEQAVKDSQNSDLEFSSVVGFSSHLQEKFDEKVAGEKEQ